ncbi:hypothetical protein [Brevundimonas sp. UBA7534]|uniref:hypothetical protein n=1 Tax=Brevundimonas sp. UBA7534 TaxID=1946138 RepID=UPI0025B9C3B5|nr:hypothetical protein [Brevundimonas sp. UBA7534]
MTQTLAEPRSRRSAETWAAARADYLSGAAAAQVCERHGLSLSTFRWRARTEGWRRADHLVGSPFVPLDDEELDLIDQGLPLNAADMARLAWSNAARAMREGRLIETRGWTRLHEDLTRIAADDDHRRRLHQRWSQDPEKVVNLPTAPPLRPVEED